MNDKLLKIMRTSPVIPVIAIENPDHAVPLARALVDGGLRVLEITLRTRYALKAIEAISREVPDAIIGVGTLTKPDQFLASRDAGAVFGVSPGLTPALVEASTRSGLPLLPGVMTPSEIMKALEYGFNNLKLFPAVPAGGVAMLKSIAGPLPDVVFCPTGGITPETAPDFLACKNVACVGGSWVTPVSAVYNKDWSTIKELAKVANALAQK